MQLLPVTVATLAGLSLLAIAEDAVPQGQMSRQDISLNTTGEHVDDRMHGIAALASGKEGVTRISLGDLGEMVIGMSMGVHEDHDHDEDAANIGDDSFQLNLDELTDGKVSGHIMINMNDLMSGEKARNISGSHIDLQMVMEDENGRRSLSRSYTNDHQGHAGVPAHRIMPGDMVMGSTGFAPGMIMGVPAPGMQMHGNHEAMEELFHNQFQMMEELEHLRHELDSFREDGEDHWDEDDRRAHMEEMMHHARELESHLDQHRDEMDDQEREDIEREIHHLHEEMRHMHQAGHHEQHDGHQDPFFGMATDFVHKIAMAGRMASSLNDRESVAVFSIWMARQHLQPEARVELLSPMMKDESLYVSVRNAATWVVMDALGEMRRESDARNALADLIRSNGTK